MKFINGTEAELKLIKTVKHKETKKVSCAVYYPCYENNVLGAISAMDLGWLEDDNGYDIDVDCDGIPKKVRQGQWIVFNKKANTLEVLDKETFTEKYKVTE